MVSEHHRSVWLFVRRLGVHSGDVDDVVQEVILVAARKLDRIEPGKEKSFMMGTAYRVASDTRRRRERRGEVSDEVLAETVDPQAGPEEIVAQRHTRAALDRVLDGLPPAMRGVFVLYELDGLTKAEIADTLSLPVGTVASRLRRARDLFLERAKRAEQRRAL